MTSILAGRVAIITGGAGDVGRMVVRRFLEEGASVLATDHDEAAVTAATAPLAGIGPVMAYRHDVTSPQGWQAAVAAAVEQFGTLDILVNCAGVTPVSLVEHMTLDEWNRVVAINATGPFLGIQAALPALRQAASRDLGDAAIVNIASAQGFIAGQPGLSGYAASKGALRLFSRTAAVEFGRLGYNVRCNCVVPSAIGGTQLMNSQIALQVERGVFASHDDGVRTITANFPLGRTAAPVDVAEAAAFLASTRARSITGTDLVVDGGRCA